MGWIVQIVLLGWGQEEIIERIFIEDGKISSRNQSCNETYACQALWVPVPLVA